MELVGYEVMKGIQDELRNRKGGWKMVKRKDALQDSKNMR